MKKIKRALISVTDKSKLASLAEILADYDCEIISTGGTKKYLQEKGFNVTGITKETGNPEAFAGRMKTISFNIGAALLFKRDEQKDEAKRLGIKPIDLVVCNLYNFKEKKEENVSHTELIENIDIGGTFMIRAAAKNYKDVATIVDPEDYEIIGEELNENDGSLSLNTRTQLMRKVFNYTADYDSFIATSMDEFAGKKSLRLSYRDGKELRYGENPHQKALVYKNAEINSIIDNIEQQHGKPLSFNNLIDINAALNTIFHFEKPACAIIKHTNACGLCSGSNMRTNLELAWAGDPISAFGSIIVFNDKVDLNTVSFFDFKNEDKSKRKFIEVIVAPKFTKKAKDYLFSKKSLRVIKYNPALQTNDKSMRFINGALLVQEKDNKLYKELKVVTAKKLGKHFSEQLCNFGIKAIKNVKSNAIILVRKKGEAFQLLGMGAGQPNRVVSVKLSLEKARSNLKNEFSGDKEEFDTYFRGAMKKTLLVSDAFFPFADNIEVAHKQGIEMFVQPGGSIRDKYVIKKCNELGCSMIFTKMRHFKH